MTPDAVDVVAVNYRTFPDVVRLVASLQSQSSPRWRLTVVDNSGDEDEYERLAGLESPGKVRLLSAGQNLGYLGGARLALDRGARRPGHWLVVCNADIVFAPDFVRVLLEMSTGHVLAPAVVSSSTGRDQNPFWARRPRRRDLVRWTWEFRWVPVARLVLIAGHALSRSQRRSGARAAGAEIYAPHGSCLVLPPTYFERGGSLKHPPFLFAEEFTIAEQCRRMGLRVVYEPALRVTHREHAATGLWRSRRIVEAQRDSVKFAVDLLRRQG